MRRATLLALALALSCLHVAAQVDAPASPLVEAYRAALSFDPAYRAARQEQLAAQEGIALAAGARRPEVSLTGTGAFNSLEQRAGAVTRSPDYTSSSVGVQLRQPLINRELESREAQARLRARQADAVLAVRALELGERLVEAYVQLAHANALVQLSGEELERQAQVVESARRSLRGGEGTTTEVLEAASRADLLRAQKGAAQTAVENARETLLGLTGPGFVPPAPRLASRLPPPPSGPGPDGLVDAMLATHPEVQARELGVDLARENINAARAPYRTRVDWWVGVSRSDSDVINTINQVNTLRSTGVQLSVPLYSGGREGAATRQAQLLAGKAEADLDAARESLRLKLRQALRGLDASGQRWQALQSARQSTRQLVDATRRSIAGGVRSRLDLLLAERQLAEVLREEQDALAEHLRAWWRAASARGTAAEPELRQLEQSIAP